jgi:hypothetical protein
MTGTILRSSVARAISLVTTAVVLVIVAGILLIVLEANPANDIVDLVTDVADFLASPFERLFTLDDHKGEVAINWGIAAAVYLVVGRIAAGIVSR